MKYYVVITEVNNDIYGKSFLLYEVREDLFDDFKKRNNVVEVIDIVEY